jgi:Na+-transporting NADH:ubiquinone oxidoreductase subunit NqrC
MNTKTILILIFLILVSGFVVYGVIIHLQQRQRTSKFLSTQGQMTKVWVDFKKIASSAGPSSQYRVYGNYSYILNETEYKGTNIYSIELFEGEISMSKADALKIANGLPTEITVYYNPENPQESFLIH